MGNDWKRGQKFSAPLANFEKKKQNENNVLSLFFKKKCLLKSCVFSPPSPSKLVVLAPEVVKLYQKGDLYVISVSLLRSEGTRTVRYSNSRDSSPLNLLSPPSVFGTLMMSRLENKKKVYWVLSLLCANNATDLFCFQPILIRRNWALRFFVFLMSH